MMVPFTHDGSNTFRSMYPDITAYGTRPGSGFNYSQSEKAYGDRLRSIMSSIIQEPLGCADGRKIIAIMVTRRVAFGGRVLRCPRVGDRTMNNNESTTRTQYTLLVNSYKNSKPNVTNHTYAPIRN